MTDRFEGFADARGTFFKRLAKNQNKAWFTAHKAEYEEGWHQPMTLLLGELAAALDDAYPHAELGEPHVMRIYRDVRFSKDKTPYKTFIAGGVPLKSAKAKMGEAPSALYVSVSAAECYAGGGLYAMDPPRLEKFRRAVLDDARGAELAKLMRALEKKGYTFAAAETLKKPPKGVDPDHPLVETLKRKGLVVMAPKPPRDLLASRAFLDHLVKTAKPIAPLVEWLAFATA